MVAFAIYSPGSMYFLCSARPSVLFSGISAYYGPESKCFLCFQDLTIMLLYATSFVLLLYYTTILCHFISFFAATM